MKNLTIALTLASSLMIGSTAFAEDTKAIESNASKVETIVVVAEPEVANFEIFSLKLAEEAMDSAVEVMAESVSSSLTEAGNSLMNTALTLSSSI